MNFPIIAYVIGWILRIEGVILLMPFFVGLSYHEKNPFLYLYVALGSYLVGTLFSLRKPRQTNISPRDGFVSVALGWIVMSSVGAIVFVLTGDIPSYVDALFETISGFTTTGASILTDVEALSRSGLFFRSFTHWIGGMGVFVFIMAVLPMLGGSSMNLIKAESTGPSVGKMVPKVKDTAKVLYAMYVGLTLTEMVMLLCGGMTLFEASTLTFGTVGTGGFGILNSSIGSYSAYTQIVITVFMILSGINFSFYFCLIRKQFKQAVTMEEIRWYLFIIFSAIALISINIWELYATPGETIRTAAFQVGSIITTTGYSTADFNLWPEFSKTVLVILMFIGGCAGSTGGGMKVARIALMCKSVKREIATMVHPRAVSKIKMDGHEVPADAIRATNVYLCVYVIILLGSTLIVSLDGFNFQTSFTSIVATLNNIGPGLDSVGPTGNFAAFSPLSKIVMMLNMLIGRLEIFPMLMLFSPRAWRKQ